MKQILYERKLSNKVLQLGAKHALFSVDGKWYENLKKFPGVLFDDRGYIIFENEDDYKINPDLQIGKKLNVPRGIRKLDGYKPFSEIENLFIKKEDPNSSVEDVRRAIQKIDRILRNQKLVDEIKELYNNTCQLCNTQIQINQGIHYSEVHHIIGLGKPHNGKDILENMICVCPNCHILLDFKAIRLEKQSFVLAKHNISEDSIAYHNSFVSN